MKCYPTKSVNVTICDHNKNGRCDFFNKRCNNTQEDLTKINPVDFFEPHLLDDLIEDEEHRLDLLE